MPHPRYIKKLISHVYGRVDCLKGFIINQLSLYKKLVSVPATPPTLFSVIARFRSFAMQLGSKLNSGMHCTYYGRNVSASPTGWNFPLSLSVTTDMDFCILFSPTPHCCPERCHHYRRQHSFVSVVDNALVVLVVWPFLDSVACDLAPILHLLWPVLWLPL